MSVIERSKFRCMKIFQNLPHFLHHFEAESEADKKNEIYQNRKFSSKIEKILQKLKIFFQKIENFLQKLKIFFKN